MTFEKVQCNRQMFRTVRLASVAFFLLLVAASGHAQTVRQQATTVSRLDTLELEAAPQTAREEIRPFHFNVPEEQLADLRRRVAATKWP